MIYGPVTPALLAGTAEVANELQCPKQQLYSLRKREDFPKPITSLAATPVWDIRHIRDFKQSWERRPRTSDLTMSS
jgi:hypothetical protein